ncbi:MAG: retropepsin-like aspartic protease [Elusimicrobiota bacterium]|nr:retropepsin-like aspartic protease [Elusimicrobiota bacterium]
MKLKIDIPIVVKQVRIEGPEAVREVDLILDSGARFTSLSWETLEDIGYDPATVSERANIITANGVIEVPLLKVKKISINKLTLKNVEVICHTIPELAKVDGLLGLSFLSHFRIVMDFKKRILEIV